MSRTGPALVALVSVLTLSGCASVNGGSSRYARELAELEQSCTERGGILVPADTPRASGRPQVDYFCRLNAGSRLTSP